MQAFGIHCAIRRLSTERFVEIPAELWRAQSARMHVMVIAVLVSDLVGM
jgi:hypothetical protein